MIEKLNMFVNLFHKMLTEGNVSGARQMLLEAPMKDLVGLKSNVMHIKRALAMIDNPGIKTPDQLTAETIKTAVFWGEGDDEKETHWKRFLGTLEKEKSMVKKKKNEEKNEEPDKVEASAAPAGSTGGGKGKPFSADLLDDDEDIHSGDDEVFGDGEGAQKKAEPDVESSTKEGKAKDPGKKISALAGNTVSKGVRELSDRMSNMEGKMDRILAVLEALQERKPTPQSKGRGEGTDTQLNALQDELRTIKGLCVISAGSLIDGSKYSSEDLPEFVEISLEDFESNQK